MASNFAEMLAHLVSLANSPGWKAYAWARAKELANERTGIYAGIDEKLRVAMIAKSGK